MTAASGPAYGRVQVSNGEPVDGGAVVEFEPQATWGQVVDVVVVGFAGIDPDRDYIARTPARPAAENTPAARTARRAAHRHGVLGSH